MPRFEYEARDKTGARTAGTIEAKTRAHAARRLRARQLDPTRLAERRPPEQRWGAGFWHRLRPAPASHLAQFFSQLAALLRSGVNAHEALDELSALLGDRRLSRAAREMAAHLAEGEGLSQNMGRYPALFHEHVVGMIRVGEQFGALPEVLAALAEQFETDARISGRLKWLRLYYGTVLVLAVLVAPFPWIVSRGMSWYLVLAGTRLAPAIIGALLLLWLVGGLLRLPALAGIRSRLLMSIPGFGAPARWAALLRFLQALELSQRAGATLDRGLEMAGGTTGDPRTSAQARAAARRVRGGASLAAALADVRLVPRQVRRMLATAETAGNLEGSISTAAEWAAERREAAINPVIIGASGLALAVAAVVALAALAMAWRNFYEALFERAGV